MKNPDRVYGPYERPDGRKHVIIVYLDGSRKTQSYPRYLMEQVLGRELTIDEEVHHKDEDIFNNSLDNLEVKDSSKHRKDHFNLFLEEYYYFDCPICGEPSKKRLGSVRGNWNQGKSGPYCSRTCAGKASHK